MDPLEEQLAKLNLSNSRPYTASPSTLTACYSDAIPAKVGTGKSAVLSSNLQECNESFSELGSGARSPRKVVPIVPPKPHKKKTHIPEVPQSSIVKQICEPLYTQRLQCVDTYGANFKLNSTLPGRVPILQRKQPMYATQNSPYDKTSKVTLDNPAILEQQLEALAHHKKQLEKKEQLLRQQEQQKLKPKLSCIPKLSSTSLISDVRPYEHLNIYTNVSTPNISTTSGGNIYSNVNEKVKQFETISVDNEGCNRQQNSNAFSASDRSNFYSNIVFEKNELEDLPQALSSAGSLGLVDGREYLMFNTTEQDDEIPPPPSPVSSSYSELRRATNVYCKNPSNPLKQVNINEAVGTERYSHFPENSTNGSTVDKTENTPQTYMNVNYSNDFSSYSPALQNISQDTSDYYGYGSFSQGSSTYESIYEPINPRSSSQLSTRSNYLMYAPFMNAAQSGEVGADGILLNNSSSANLSTLGGMSTGGANTPLYLSGGLSAIDIPSKMPASSNQSKESEVEALTDFLVHSMDSASDAENYGVCYKCNERVLGENSGCTAMDQIYHITCFTCSQCKINLQGKPFYALEGKPYCEYDYLQTLEKCSVCMKPILERILRATGKPYHPQCFTCIVCGNSLDGIPFTVDATNQNYCIADFHKKFAPRCCVCKEPIMPEPGEEETVRVVALDRSFHFECYKCEDCGLLLSSEAEGRGCYPLDDHVLCKSCNAKRVQMLTNRMTTEL